MFRVSETLLIDEKGVVNVAYVTNANCRIKVTVRLFTPDFVLGYRDQFIFLLSVLLFGVDFLYLHWV